MVTQALPNTFCTFTNNFCTLIVCKSSMFLKFLNFYHFSPVIAHQNVPRWHLVHHLIPVTVLQIHLVHVSFLQQPHYLCCCWKWMWLPLQKSLVLSMFNLPLWSPFVSDIGLLRQVPNSNMPMSSKKLSNAVRMHILLTPKLLLDGSSIGKEYRVLNEENTCSQ